MPNVIVFADRYLRSWPPISPDKPAQEGPPHVESVDVETMLRRKYETDAHFVGYASPSLRRLNPGALPVEMHLLIFDIDYPKEHRVRGRAPDEWWQAEQIKVDRLLADEPGVVAFRTRGGYRLVGAVEPTSITNATDAHEWSAFYVKIAAYLNFNYGILCDPYCRDWQHLQRCPGALRDGEHESEMLIGGPVAEWKLAHYDDAGAATEAKRLGNDDREDWARAAKCLDERSNYSPLTLNVPSGNVNVDLDQVVDGLIGPISEIGVGGGRHRLYLHLSGALLDRGVPPDDLERVVETLSLQAGVDEPSEIRDRLAGARTTLNMFKTGVPYTRIGELQALHAPVAQALDRVLPDRVKAVARNALRLVRSGDTVEEVDTRPAVKINTDEFKVIDNTIAALKDNRTLFKHNGRLSEVMTVEDDIDDSVVSRAYGAPYVRTVSSARLRDIITAAVVFEKYEKRAKGWVDAHPTDWLIAGVEARGRWPGVNQLTSIGDSPVFLANGDVPTVAGYHRSSGIYMSNGVQLVIPQKPTIDDAVAAAKRVLALVEQFPFVEESHKSAWLCALLTVLARFAFVGSTPLVFVEASTAGSGKSLLVDLISAIAFNRSASRSSYSPDDEEMRKKITTVVRSGDRLILFDNVENGSLFKSSALDRVLTGDVWEDRLLGTNDSFRAPVYATFFVSGNNLTIGGDLGRRIMHIRLEPKVERPELINDFKLPHIVLHAREHRAQLLSDLFTILRAYHEAGRPDMGLPGWGSFESWSSLPRSATVWSGLTDPGDARSGLLGIADQSSLAGADLIREIFQLSEESTPKGAELSAKEILDACGSAFSTKRSALKSAIEETCNLKAGQHPTPRALGYVLRKLRGRVFNGLVLMQGGEGRAGVLWIVKKVA